jgi:hypothetical protein
MRESPRVVILLAGQHAQRLSGGKFLAGVMMARHLASMNESTLLFVRWLHDITRHSAAAGVFPTLTRLNVGGTWVA